MRIGAPPATAYPRRPRCGSAPTQADRGAHEAAESPPTVSFRRPKLREESSCHCPSQKKSGLQEETARGFLSLVAASTGTSVMGVDEKTDFREIARDGGTALSYRAGDFIFREGDTAWLHVRCAQGIGRDVDARQGRRDDSRGEALRDVVPDRQKPRANSARAKEDANWRFSTSGPSVSWSRRRRVSSGT